LSTRAQILRAGLDLKNLTGAEIGALNVPIVRKDEGDILYVDRTDAETLRAHYAEDPNLDVADIVDVDAIWGTNTLAQALGRQVDYVIASHMAEHVPDLVTWLQEVREVLRPDGDLRLVLPDKRYSYDVLRPETQLSDLLTAYAVRARRPQAREVVDFLLNNAPLYDNMALFEGRLGHDEIQRLHTWEDVQGIVDRLQSDPDFYFDVHCWVFTPKVFAELMAACGERGLVSLACSHFVDTTLENGFEFFVFLRPCDQPEEVVRSWRRMADAARDAVPGSAEERRIRDRARMISEYPRQSEALSALGRRLELIERSRSWRMTALLRAASSRLQRR
jgi:SAM-dependent methyltransferase